MAVYGWKSAVSGSWDSASNWTPDGGPTTVVYDGGYSGYFTDSALFDTGSAKAYTVTGSGQAASTTVSHDNVTFKSFEGGDGTGQSSFNINDGAKVTLVGGSSIQMNGAFHSPSGVLNVSNASFDDKGVVLGNQDFGRGANVTVDGYGSVMVGTSSDFEAGSNVTVKDGGKFASSAGIFHGTVYMEGSTSVFDGKTELGAGASLHLINDAQVGGSQFYSAYSYSTGVVPSGGLATVDAGASVIGNGKIYPFNIPGDTTPLSSDVITNNGSITASGGKLDIMGSVVGSGSLNIDKGSTLEMQGDSSNNVSFLTYATLQIDKGAHETGFLQGFESTDRVDLSGQMITSFAASNVGLNTVLKLYDGSSLADQLTFKGDHFTTNNFYVANDLHGGSVAFLDPFAFVHTAIPTHTS